MYLHEVIRTPNRKYVCLSVVYSTSRKWECAYSLFDSNAMTEWWGDKTWRAADIYEFGERAGAFSNWHVVKAHCAAPATAANALRDYIAKEYAKKP